MKINICIYIVLLMPFLMVPTTSSISIDKWVIFGGKVDFSQFYHIFSYFFEKVWL